LVVAVEKPHGVVYLTENRGSPACI
jgi:hypothetical protein